MLFHPRQHEALLALREAELSRRSRLRWPPPAEDRQPVRHRAATLLRLVADRLDPQSGAAPASRPPGPGPFRGPAASYRPPLRQDIDRFASLLSGLDERAPALFLGRRIG